MAVATRSAVQEKLISNVMEARARDARVLAVATEGDDAMRDFADDILWVPDTLEVLSPMLAIIPLQLFAYHMAVARGTDVDQPRNLAKSVTVEWACPRPAGPEGTTELGIDIIKVERIRAALARFGARFTQRILTDAERAYVRDRPETLAGRWAAKEAVSKVLGLGVRGVGWREIEIVRLPTGQPTVRLHDRALRRAEQLGMDRVAVSISHERDYAVAIAFGIRTRGGTFVFPVDIEARLDDRERRILARMERLRGLEAACRPGCRENPEPHGTVLGCLRRRGRGVTERAGPRLAPLRAARRGRAPRRGAGGQARPEARSARPQGHLRHAGGGVRIARLRGGGAARGHGGPSRRRRAPLPGRAGLAPAALRRPPHRGHHSMGCPRRPRERSIRWRRWP